MRPVSRHAAVLALAWAGTVTGHVVGYAIGHPGAPEREAWLRATGHGSFELLLLAAATAGGAGLAITALRSDPPMRVRSLAARLLLIQLAMFSFVEVAERSFDASVAVGDPAVLLGLLLQIATAVGLAILAQGAHHAAQAIILRWQVLHPRAPRLVLYPGTRTQFPARLTFFSHARRRAPPLPLAA